MYLHGQFVIMRNLGFFVLIAHLPINEPFPKRIGEAQAYFQRQALWIFSGGNQRDGFTI